MGFIKCFDVRRLDRLLLRIPKIYGNENLVKNVKAYRTATGQYRIKKKDFEKFINSRLIFFNMDEDAHRKKVLIVDDDAGFRKFVRRVVSELDMETVEAINSFEAGFKIAESNPSLIVLDLNMPGIDGFEVYRSIRSEAKNKKIKIMVVTGNGMSKLEKQIRDLGADDFLQKPVGMKELHQRIQILLSENIKR